MKIIKNEIIHVRDVSTDGHLRLDAMFNFMQEMAVFHTHEVGITMNDLIGSDKTWVLNRVVAQISQLPKLEEPIKLITWSRKLHRFKGVRDYEIAVNNRPIIKASSLWIFIDLKKGRPARVPGDYRDRYGIVEEQATTIDVEEIEFNPVTNADYTLNIATRVSDYDINGHVNNAALLQFIETALTRFYLRKIVAGEIQLTFLKEIPLAANEVNVLLQQTSTGCLFEITNKDMVCVRGAVSIQQQD